VVTDQVKKRFACREITGQTQGMSVAAWLALFDKMELAGMFSSCLGVGVLISRDNDEANAIDARNDHFFEDDLQSGFFHAVSIHQRLQRQAPLVSPARSDDRLAYIHGTIS
jgi:hypothetical protein